MENLDLLINIAIAFLFILGMYVTLLFIGGVWAFTDRLKQNRIADDMEDGDFSGSPGAVRPELEEEFNDWMEGGFDTLTFKGIDITAMSETETRIVLFRLLNEERLKSQMSGRH